MSFLTECIAFLVTGDARYGTDNTPLDRLNQKANKGLEIYEKLNKPKRKKLKQVK